MMMKQNKGKINESLDVIRPDLKGPRS